MITHDVRRKTLSVVVACSVSLFCLITGCSGGGSNSTSGTSSASTDGSLAESSQAAEQSTSTAPDEPPVASADETTDAPSPSDAESSLDDPTPSTGSDSTDIATPSDPGPSEDTAGPDSSQSPSVLRTQDVGRPLTLGDIFKNSGKWADDRYSVASRDGITGIGDTVTSCDPSTPD